MSPKIALLCSGCSHVRRGLEDFTERLYLALKERGANVHLFGGSSNHQMGTRGLPCFGGKLLPTLRNHRWGLRLEQRTFTISFLAVQLLESFDVVMVGERAVANLLLWARQRFGFKWFKLIYSTSAGIDAHKLMRYDYLRHATPVAYEKSLALGFPEEHMRMIPHGFNLRAAIENRSELKVPTGAFVILYAAAFIEEKRHSFLLDALDLCSDGVPELFVAFAGEKGPTYEKIATRLQQSFSSNFCGTLDTNQMDSLYASADLYVHARLGESFGNAFIRAHAQGLPVIAHDTPVHRFVMPSGAILMDMTNARTVADQIVFLYTNREKRWKLRDEAFENVKRFDMQQIAPQFIEMFADFSRDLVPSRSKLRTLSFQK